MTKLLSTFEAGKLGDYLSSDPRHPPYGHQQAKAHRRQRLAINRRQRGSRITKRAA